MVSNKIIRPWILWQPTFSTAFLLISGPWVIPAPIPSPTLSSLSIASANLLINLSYIPSCTKNLLAHTQVCQYMKNRFISIGIISTGIIYFNRNYFNKNYFNRNNGNDPKFLDRQVWANNVDPYQTALFHLHVLDTLLYGKTHCSNFEDYSNFSGVRIFQISTVFFFHVVSCIFS